MNIGFIGAGRMGRAMAKNLMRAGHEVAVYNRTLSKAEELAREGARLARSPADAAKEAEVLISMLADDDAVVGALLDGPEAAIQALGPGCVHVSSSTIGTDLSRRLARAHAEVGQHYVAAPVLGRPEAAAHAQLVFLAAGATDAIERCKPLLGVMGKKIHVFGEQPEQANAVKLASNLLLATIIEGLGEAYALVERFGVDDLRLLEIADGFLPTAFTNYGKRIADDSFEPAGFRLRLGLKDVRLAIEAGESHALALPFASVLHDRFVSAIAHGKENADWSAVARTR